MLDYLDKRHIESRIGYVNGVDTPHPTKNGKTRASRSRWHLSVWVALVAVGYHILGAVVQRLEPTAGWLDTGSMSIALFAAWSCMLGVALAGLLPALIVTIGKKGGMKGWKTPHLNIAMLVLYAGYIVVLCALL